jgi:tellurite resistance protein
LDPQDGHPPVNESRVCDLIEEVVIGLDLVAASPRLGIRLDSTAFAHIEGGHMAGKADFSEDEWRNLQQGVTGAGMLVSAAHRDFTDSFGEASAVGKQLAGHRASESQLVRELAETRSTGFGLVASPKEVVEGTMNALGAAVAALGAKAPDELDAYRRLVLDVATAVAEAKGGVKDEETAAIAKITRALGAA